MALVPAKPLAGNSEMGVWIIVGNRPTWVAMEQKLCYGRTVWSRLEKFLRPGEKGVKGICLLIGMWLNTTSRD